MNKILLGEKDFDNCALLTELLELEGFKVTCTDNGLQVVQLAQEMHPDLILCNWYLIDLNGLELLKSLKERQETSSIPFIFLTTHANFDAKVASLRLGADEYLIKPIEFQRLLQVITTYLKSTAIAN